MRERPLSSRTNQVIVPVSYGVVNLLLIAFSSGNMGQHSENCYFFYQCLSNLCYLVDWQPLWPVAAVVYVERCVGSFGAAMLDAA